MSMRKVESLELRVGPSQREVSGHDVTRQFPTEDGSMINKIGCLEFLFHVFFDMPLHTYLINNERIMLQM